MSTSNFKRYSNDGRRPDKARSGREDAGRSSLIVLVVGVLQAVAP
jgi:hypothetical protein